MKFKLDAVLKLRLQNEENQKRILGKLRMSLDQEQDVYEQLLEEKQLFLEDYTKAVWGQIDVRELEGMRQYLLLLGGHIKKQILRIEEIQEQIHQQQLHLQEAMKERKMMENLKEVHFERWLEKEKHEEQRLTDELVSYQYSVGERSD